jgi:hypothetical protein
MGRHFRDCSPAAPSQVSQCLDQWCKKTRSCILQRFHHLSRMRTLPYSLRYSYGASSHAERLARLDMLANLLDTALVIPGTGIRFGFDAIVGLVPGIGDALTTAVSLYIVHEASSARHGMSFPECWPTSLSMASLAPSRFWATPLT